MYGMPGSNLETWQENLQNVLKFNPPHLSCYNLTIEMELLKHQVDIGQISFQTKSKYVTIPLFDTMGKDQWV